MGLLAVALVTTSPTLFADQAPTAPPGYKIVNIPAGGRTIPVLVKDQSDPLKNVGKSGTGGNYDPQKLFSSRSMMADKTFSSGADTNFEHDALSKSDRTFVTKTYLDPAVASGNHFDTKENLPTAAAYSRGATGFDRAFATASADDQTRTASFAGTSTSSYQNRTAAFVGPQTPEDMAFRPLAEKQYLGPGAQNVPAGYEIKENVVISRMSGLPNRPLSIDEVRNLINHDTKPNTDVPAAEPTKALNDPDYKPEPSRDVPTRTDDDDKGDAVPPPGMMAAPENAEPLPQR